MKRCAIYLYHHPLTALQPSIFTLDQLIKTLLEHVLLSKISKVCFKWQPKPHFLVTTNLYNTGVPQSNSKKTTHLDSEM